MRFAGFAILALLVGSGTTNAQVTSYESEGNLKLSHELSCITMAEVKNDYTPPDLIRARGLCYKEGRLDDAAQLFFTAGAYARFDMLRVTDKTAHQAWQVLLMNNAPDDATRAKIEPVFRKYLAPDAPEHIALCKALKKLGPPSYDPTYMIQHGMGAFMGGGAKGKIAADFDAKQSWKLVLDKYLHCDVADM